MTTTQITTRITPLTSSRWTAGASRLLASTLFVALASTWALTAEAAPREGRMHHGAGPMMDGGMGHGRMLDAVGASAEQRAQIKAIFDAARTELKPQHDAARALREQSRVLFAQTPVDGNAAEALRQQKMALHDQVSRRMLQAMLAASAVLTPEQRAKLAEMAAQRHGRMERRQGPAQK